MVTRNNFSGLKSGTVFEGVDAVILVVDYINAMSAETQDPADPNSTRAGLKIIQDLVGSYVNVLSVSPLHDADTQQSFLVRKDSVTNTLKTELQAAIRALGSPQHSQITANMGSQTVTFREVAVEKDQGKQDSELL